MTNSDIKFSIIVCFNNQDLYDDFVETISKSNSVNYEIININNCHGRYSLPEALNEGSKRAQGGIYLFCHQDIRFPVFWLDRVAQQIEIVGANDHKWGVLGIMGVKQNGFFAGNIIDPHTKERFGDLPSEVVSLDEVCLVVRKGSGLLFDESLGGFHLYGADICLQARQAGLKCYAIDAPFEHLSRGKVDDSFWELAKKLKEKWKYIESSPLVIETTCGVFQLQDGIFATFTAHYKLLRRKFVRRIQGRHRKVIDA